MSRQGYGGKNGDFPRRPSYGSKGEETCLWANYAEIYLRNSGTILYRYEISLKPEVEGKKAARVISLFLKTRGEDIFTDFRSILLSKTELPTGSSTIHYYPEEELEPRNNAKQYTIKLELKRELPLSDLNEYLASNGSSASYPLKDEMVQALNIFVNHLSKTNPNVVTVGSSKVFNRERPPSKDLEGGLKAVRGYYTSVRLATSRLLVNVNVCHAIFYKDGSLLDLVKEFRGYWQNNNIRGDLGSFLKRLRVEPTHLSTRNKEGKPISRVKTIFGLATGKDGVKLDHPPEVPSYGANSIQVKFWWSNPEQGEEGYISVQDYFTRQYGRTLSEPGAPVINVGNLEKPTYLPLEMCKVLPKQVAKTKLGPVQITKMIQFAIRNRIPANNANDIQVDGFRTVGLSTNNRDLETLGLVFSLKERAPPKLIQVRGRVLATPKVEYRNNELASVSNGAWRFYKDIKFHESGESKKWACVTLEIPDCVGLNAEQLEHFKNKFDQVLWGMGVKHSLATDLQNWRYKNDHLENMFQDAVRKQVHLLILILPRRILSNGYNTIKQLGDTKYGITTICIDGTKVTPEQLKPQYLANITMKFNLKMGGNNQFVKFDETSLKFSETMIVGIDVTHPAPGSSANEPSIAGMVASIDSSLGQWPAVVRRQEKQRQEMVSGLDEMLESRLNLWFKKHERYPKNILVYRDGVSEGQFKTVLEKELPLLRDACEWLYPDDDLVKQLPRITIVIVVKRHHTRFYPIKSEDVNPMPGTVVDRGVTEAGNWDFFLQAHQAVQGTARPIHYFVAHDEIFKSMIEERNIRGRIVKAKIKPQDAADELEHVTHGLSYIYGRATRAVSVCTPAYYADLVCDRARCYPEKSKGIHENLEETMFYI
ncbi:Piwi-domain-containing protein [Hypoxylon sp. FL1857]|nr:Piwi-domain-containing protein [Hypoxylon sp. FL1857]